MSKTKKAGLKKKFTKIAPLENLSLVDKVELRLIDFFKENNLVPGDAIPKEMEFAQSLGVSRTVVREALMRLRTLGLVESKKHRGMILTQPDVIDNFERVLDPTLLGNETLKNLFELRVFPKRCAVLGVINELPCDWKHFLSAVSRQQQP